MKYIRIHRYQDSGDNKAAEIIPEFNPIFPDVPITERYSAEFLDKCVAVEDDTEVFTGWIYDSITNTFTEPDEEEQPNPGEPTVPPDNDNAIVQEIIDMLEGRA